MSTLTLDNARRRLSASRDNTSVLPSLSRSPHPYHRQRLTIEDDDRMEAVNGLTKTAYHSPESRQSSESSESGTEADDERGPILKSLPAPPLRSRKGLRGSTPQNLTPTFSPTPTPPAEVEEDANSLLEFAGIVRTKSHQKAFDHQKRKEYSQRRRKEIARRTTETLLLFTIGGAVWINIYGDDQLSEWYAPLLLFGLTLSVTYAIYPIVKTVSIWRTRSTWKQGLYFGLHVPSRFDTGHLVYPTILPVIISLSLFKSLPSSLPVNLVAGLASMPTAAVGLSKIPAVNWYMWWLLTLLPLQRLLIFTHMFSLGDHGIQKLLSSNDTLSEILTLIFPLHQTLTSTLEFLTTTSLERSELQLLSVSLINLYLFANSPQAVILKILLWGGGVLLFVSCQHLLRWEVALARIPNWKFARHVKTGDSLLRRLDANICRYLCAIRPQLSPTSSSDSDEAKGSVTRFRSQKPSLHLKVNGLVDGKLDSGSFSATDSFPNEAGPDSEAATQKMSRRNTFSTFDADLPWAIRRWRKRTKAWTQPLTLSFVSLTSQQALVRRYAYAAAVYLIVIASVLVPIRIYIETRALAGHEPFGWAIGYLFGNISQLRLWVISTNLESWIALPLRPSLEDILNTTGLVEHYRQNILGPATTRLLIAGYCICVLFVGIGIVLSLTSIVEVDTRRKVFHGVMVAMLLPTIFIDPCFIALALSLILAIFLLLDLFRASQLPPVSRPLTNFLAPYVDGRDHRGPVIVSHIFLLIGCAIPLWLSLAGTQRSGMGPWTGWDVTTRDLSMISGVVCVGMGDAAASLVGRRYGKTKWYWVGGKSLEGSAAFAAAVTCGLVASHTWLRLGGWREWESGCLTLTLSKSILAGVGASLLESTLTAANDNVVVPVGLWLLVRGLDI